MCKRKSSRGAERPVCGQHRSRHPPVAQVPRAVEGGRPRRSVVMANGLLLRSFEVNGKLSLLNGFPCPTLLISGA